MYMRYYRKGENTGFFKKASTGKFLSTAKSLAGVLDNPIAETIVTALNPELGMGLHAVRSSGLLERIKK